MENNTFTPTPPPTNSVTPPPIQALSTPKSNHALVIILIVLLVTAIGTGSYYYLQYQKLASTPLSTSTQTLSAETLVKADPTAEWKAYSSNKYQFSFKHPQSWDLNSPDPSGDFEISGMLHLYAIPSGSITLSLEVIPIQGTSLTSQLNLIEHYQWESLSKSNTITDGSKTTIFSGTINDKSKRVAIFATESYIYILQSVVLDDLQNLNDILSTFKFTNDTKSLTTPPGSNRYTSEKLGVSFYYQVKQGEETFSAKEVGNKIYVHANISPPDQGQYLEVFEKSASDTLENAIKKTILSGYSQTDCKIDLDPDGFTTSNINPTFKSAQLTVEVEGDWDMEKAMQKASNCPTKYMAIGGLNYFLSDPNYPTKFIFVSIGQYAIQGDSQKLWQDTLEFVD